MNSPSPSADEPSARIADLRRAVGAGRSAAGHRALTQPSGAIDATAVAFSVFSKLLESDGIRAAMYSLLRRTDYRFISIFRFQGGMATSAVHVDREDLTATQAGEVPETATYCCYVRDGHGAFVTADALMDPRTVNHAAREAVRAYCGIPIIDPEGGLIGTLCHYDFAPRDPGQLDLELLLQAASAIERSGLVPPYPALAGRPEARRFTRASSCFWPVFAGARNGHVGLGHASGSNRGSRPARRRCCSRPWACCLRWWRTGAPT